MAGCGRSTGTCWWTENPEHREAEGSQDLQQESRSKALTAGNGTAQHSAWAPRPRHAASQRHLRWVCLPGPREKKLTKLVGKLVPSDRKSNSTLLAPQPSGFSHSASSVSFHGAGVGSKLSWKSESRLDSFPRRYPLCDSPHIWGTRFSDESPGSKQNPGLGLASLSRQTHEHSQNTHRLENFQHVRIQSTLGCRQTHRPAGTS